MTNDEAAAKKVEEIEALYRGAIARLTALKEEQFQIIEEFVSAIQKDHLKKLRERVAGSQSDQP